MQSEFEPKTVRVDHDDNYTVAVSRTYEQVYVTVNEFGGYSIGTYIDPKDARRLARALKRAANVAEGKPAKAKRRVIDGDGDTWHLGFDGLYTCPSEPHLRPISLDALREEWGIAGERA